MAALGWLFLSGIMGTITGFAVPLMWEHRLALGLAVFIVMQFGVFTPIRMWRNAVWVQNIEKSLDGLWDLHEEGTVILNEDVVYLSEHPDWEKESEATNQWVRAWISKEDAWEDKTQKALALFSPLDARRLKLVVTFEPNRISGIPNNRIHIFRKNLLATKLERLGDMLEKHHPSQLPE